VLVLAAFRCLLALIRYALPPIRRSASFAFQASWSTLALLALTVATSVELSSLLLMLACCPLTTDAAAAMTVPAPLWELRRRRRLDAGPVDLPRIARSIDACFRAAQVQAMVQPAPELDDMGDLLLVNNTRRRRAMRRMMQHHLHHHHH